MKTALFLTALLALAGVTFAARNLEDDIKFRCYGPEADCSLRCKHVFPDTLGHEDYCKKCNMPSEKHEEMPCDDFKCKADDWKCAQCYEAASCHPMATRYALARLCHKTYTESNDAASVQCIKDNKDSETAKQCIRGITDYKIEGWASNQWCAQPSLNRDTQKTCMHCLADVKCNNKWGCNNCLVNSCGDDKKMRACADAVQYGADAWAAGECLKLSCEREIQECLACLVSLHRGHLRHYNNNAWFCLKKATAPKPCYKYNEALTYGPVDAAVAVPVA